MCHKVSNNRPACPPRAETPPPVSPERPTQGIQSARDNVQRGHAQNDVFEGNRCAQKAQKKEKGLFQKLEKLFQKLEKYLPGVGDFVRDMVNAIQKDRNPVEDVADKVRRQPALPAPR